MSRSIRNDNILEQDNSAFTSPRVTSKQQWQFSSKPIANTFNWKASVPDDAFSKNPVLLTIRKEQRERLWDEVNEAFAEKIRKNYQNSIKVNIIPPKGYNYKDYKDVHLSEKIMNNSGWNKISNVIAEVRKFDGLEDPRDQVEGCVLICRETLDILKNNHVSNSENYCASTLRLFYQAVKRNYAQGLFTSEQVRLMLDMLEECQSGYVDKERYWEFDERLYDVHLSVFPEED